MGSSRDAEARLPLGTLSPHPGEPSTVAKDTTATRSPLEPSLTHPACVSPGQKDEQTIGQEAHRSQCNTLEGAGVGRESPPSGEAFGRDTGRLGT